MEKKADLHVHTYYSDGTFSPEEAMKGARRAGLSVVAICDHDCTDGAAECSRMSGKYGVEVIAGVEITADIEDTEVHILGYCMDMSAGPLVEMVKNLKKSRVDRIYAMIEKLRKRGVTLDPVSVFSLSGRGTVGRLHLAHALYESGYVNSVKEAFIKYISDSGPCYVARFNAVPEEAINSILESGGVPVYAHPGAMGRDDFIPHFMKSGLRGIEAYHTDHTKATGERYASMAEKYGLLVTGGSDCHGDHKGRIGEVAVPYSFVERLRDEAEIVRKEYRIA